MRTAIFGANGQLGRDLRERFSGAGEVACADLPDLDIADLAAVEEFISGARPELVINAAAYTDVEGAEDNPAAAFRVNETGAANVARTSARHGAAVVYYSTDFVFDGLKNAPYVPEDAPGPGSVYAESKLAGEHATREANERHCIIRTAWLYGPGGNNFVEKIIRAAETRRELKVVQDEIGSPTYTYDLAEATAALASQGAAGVYHVVNGGQCSRYEFAINIISLAGLEASVAPCLAADFPVKARRPAYSVMSNEKYERDTGRKMRPWDAALADYVKRRNQQR